MKPYSQPISNYLDRADYESSRGNPVWRLIRKLLLWWIFED